MNTGKYFLFNPLDNELLRFTSAEGRDAAARSLVSDCLEDGEWLDEVLQIVVGEITGEAQHVNIEKRPGTFDGNGEDGEGRTWPSGIDEMFDVEIRPVE
jgi:hypothetical protein